MKPWNKGLAKETDERVKRNSERISKPKSEKGKQNMKGHTGTYKRTQKMLDNMKGHTGIYKRTQKNIENLSKAHKNRNEKSYYKNKNVFVREDLGHLCRSKPEANFCRILKYLEINYKYEKWFKLEEGKRYAPDCYCEKLNLAYEFKGRMYKDAEEKIELFRQKYPEIKLIVIMQTSKEWKRLEKYFKDKIKEWE